VNAGDLDQRIRIEAKVQARDTLGGETTAWSLLAAVWAKVMPVPGGRFSWEKVEGGELRASENYRFTIRRRPDVVPTMRVVWPLDAQDNATSASLQFNIRFRGEPSTRDLYQVIDAEAGVAM
jgi:head-tail adaptor